MGSMEKFLTGKKTYLVAAGMVLLAGLKQQGYISDEVFQILEAVLLGGGLAALRAGLGKGLPSK